MDLPRNSEQLKPVVARDVLQNCAQLPGTPFYGYDVVGVGQVMLVGHDGIGVSCRSSCRSHCPATQTNRSMPRHTPTAMVSTRPSHLDTSATMSTMLLPMSRAVKATLLPISRAVSCSGGADARGGTYPGGGRMSLIAALCLSVGRADPVPDGSANIVPRQRCAHKTKSARCQDLVSHATYAID